MWWELTVIKGKSLQDDNELKRLKRKLDRLTRSYERLKDRYRASFENAADPIVIMETSGNIVDINNTFVYETGYDRKKIIGNNIFNTGIITADSAERIAGIIARYSGGKERPTFEISGIHKNGEIVPYELRAHLSRTVTGAPVFYAILRNIKDRKETELALEQSVKLFKSIFDSSPLGMFIYELDSEEQLILRNTNPAADAILGISCRDLIGKTITDAFPNLADTEIPGKYKEIASRGISWHMGQMAYRDGKTQGVFEIDAFQISKGRMVVIFSDKTKTKMAEQALRESEERFRSVLENSPAGICIVDDQFKVVYANEILSKIFDIPRETIVSSTIQQLLPKDKQDFIARRLIQRQKGEVIPDKYEIELRKSNGEKILVEINASLVPSPEGKFLTIAQILDVTKQRRLEEQLKQTEKMRAVGQLAGGIAHDFNNILTVINGYAEIALRQVIDSDAVHMHLNEILKAGKKAEKFTRQLLGFSRKQLIQLKVLHIETIVNDLTKMLRHLIGEDIILEAKTGEHVSPVKADPGQLEQILVNLVVNARDALESRPGSGTEKKIIITIDDIFLDENFVRSNPGSIVGPHVRLAVADNGIGMNRDVRSRIFEPFFSTKDRDRGTGLGMATVYGIVKQNNGSIYVSSQPDEGATVEIFWPVCQENISATEDHDDNQHIEPGKGTILLVEDDHDVRELIFNSLNTMGYHVIQAGDGNEALNIINKNHSLIDLLLTDIIMPNMGGRELAEAVLKIKPDLKILFTSGYSDNKIGQDGVLSGDINFIQKPYTLQHLSAKVKSLIDH